MNSNNLAGTEISSNKLAGTGQSLAEINWQRLGSMQLVNLQTELEEVEGTNKKISKQRGLQSSNSKQQGRTASIRADLVACNW